MIATLNAERKTVVVIGNGMVGHRFCERMAAYDTKREFDVVTFCEEPRPAYDRVNLTKYFEQPGCCAPQACMPEWYAENGIMLHVGDRATEIDRTAPRWCCRSKAARSVTTTSCWPPARRLLFPRCLALIRRVFVYRTIEDLERILAYAGGSKSVAVIGGGLLGLEAAKAVLDLGLTTHVVEYAPRLMPRQVDEVGSRTLLEKIQALDVQVHLGKRTLKFAGNGKVEGLEFSDGSELNVDMVVISAGIRPRDELARDCGLEVGVPGGVVVDDTLRTSDPAILAIGEVAWHRGMVYGLVAPGYEMADVAAATLTGA